MSVRWKASLLELIAPGGASVRPGPIACLKDEFPEADHWLGNFFLNSTLSGSFGPRWHRLALAFLRRAQSGFRAYHRARSLTMEYAEFVPAHNPVAQRYYDAVGEWETFVLQSAMALDLFKWMNDLEGAFVKNDGSKECRLYTMANHVKHVGNRVGSDQNSASEVVPLWLTNSGLASYGGTMLTYPEAAEVLIDIARLADELQNPVEFAARS